MRDCAVLRINREQITKRPDSVWADAARPGNGAPLDGVNVEAASAWFAARRAPRTSTRSMLKASGADHLRPVHEEAQAIVDRALEEH
jgi:phosphoglucomutase